MVWDALKNEYNAGDPGGSSAKGLVLSALPAKRWLTGSLQLRVSLNRGNNSGDWGSGCHAWGYDPGYLLTSTGSQASIHATRPSYKKLRFTEICQVHAATTSSNIKP